MTKLRFATSRVQRGVVAIEYALLAAGIAAFLVPFMGVSGSNGLTRLLTDLFCKIKSLV